MRAVILYRNDEDYYPDVRTWLEDFRRGFPDKTIEEIDPDSSEGVALRTTYDFVELPTIAALADDGSVLGQWSGEPLPMLDEVAQYAAERSSDFLNDEMTMANDGEATK